MQSAETRNGSGKCTNRRKQEDDNKWDSKEIIDMVQVEIIGLTVLGLSALSGLFFTLHKPINDNTRAMTKLTMKIENIVKQNERMEKAHDEHLEEFEEYKEKVRESQRRQWQAIEQNKSDIVSLKYGKE